MGMFFDSKQEKLDKKLYKAISARDLGRVHAALEEGAAREPNGYWGWMYHAANNRFPEAIALLAEKGCPVDAAGPYGYTALRYAISIGRSDMAALLLEHGADINGKDNNGSTPLHVAADSGKMDMIAFLLERGADMQARDNHMNTPADVASKDYPRIAEFLWQKMGIPVDGAEKKKHDVKAGWHLTADDEIAHVSDKPAIGYRITEMFNFHAQMYTCVTQNTLTQAESSTVKTFDEMDGSPLLDEAFDLFREKGGRAEVYTRAKAKPSGLSRNNRG